MIETGLSPFETDYDGLRVTRERLDVAVIGAGLAGCAAAYTLSGLGYRVLLLEREGHVGGRAWTFREGGFTIDTGATILLSVYDRTLGLIRGLGRADDLVVCRGRTGFYDGQRLHLLRIESPSSYLRLGLLSWRDKARLAARGALLSLRPGPGLFDLDSLAVADRGESIASWARRSFGDAGYEYVVRPNLEGLSGVSCEEASAASAIAFFGASGVRGLRMFALRDGFDSLCAWLGQQVTVRLGTRVMRCEDRGDHVAVATDGDSMDVAGAIVATDAVVAAELVAAGPARDVLHATRYAANIHVALGYAEDPWPNAPADAVFPVGPGERTLGSLALLSRKSRTLVPAGAQAAGIYFGDRTARLLTSDAEAVTRARETVERLLGPAPAPLFERVFRRPRAVPIHPPGEFARLLAASAATPSRVKLAGDYLFHQTAEAAIRSGQHAARELAAQLS